MKSSIYDHVRVFGSFIGLYILHYFLMQYAGSLFQSQTTSAYFAALFIVISVATGVLLFYLKLAGKDTFLLNGIRGKIWFWTLLLCISQYLLICSVIFGYPALISKSDISSMYFTRCFNQVVCYSIVVEILFRGLLQKQLSKITAPWLAISITTIISMLVNFNNIPSLPHALLSGIFIGILYHKTDKIILCILYRSFYNLLFNLSIFSSDHFTPVQGMSFILAIALAVYTIYGFMKDKTKFILKNE